MADTKAVAITAMSPEGRLINGSLFEKDVFKHEKGGEGKPEYKAEMAFDDNDELAEFEDKAIEAAVQEWGGQAEEWYENGTITSPFKDGDAIADRREANGKPGDAYRGKLILRAHTQFNRNGDDAPGGVYVCNEQAEELQIAQRGEIYNGCLGKIAVTFGTNIVNGQRFVTAYLNGFQKTGEGERLRGSDPSSLFKPMMGKGSESKGRRSRRG